MQTATDEKLIKVLGQYLNQQLGNKVGIAFKVVDIKGTSFLMPELPDDDNTIERITASIENRLNPAPE